VSHVQLVVPEVRGRRRALLVALALVVACAIAALVSVTSSGEGTPAVTAAHAPAAAPRPEVPEAVATPQKQDPAATHPKARPHVVQTLAPGQAPPDAAAVGKSAPPSDAEVRAELSQFRQHLANVGDAPRGEVPMVRSDGTAVAPLDAPSVVAQVIAAGNEIATTPYKWGGGHGAWRDSGYDCSGSVSFALAGAGLLNTPLDSTRFMHYGEPGPGRWITIYANSGHAFMVVAGLRFDTSGATGGTRWQPANGRSYAGFAVRHPPGL
jgi:cell wall-associated NlpC family hydrolase